jgi:glycosyltransferase involved in cell wall biosynthesis
MTARVPVAHLIHTMAYGGVETALINWLTRIPRDGFEAHLICFANPGETERPFVEAANAAGLRVLRIPWHRGKPVWRSARALKRILEENGIRILHCHNTYANLVGLLAGRLARVLTTTTLYVWGEFGWKRGMLQWMDRAMLPWFDRITAHCEETRRQTIAMGYRPEEVSLLVCGFEAKPVTTAVEERRARRAELGASDSDRVLINVARFYPEKAHDVLLEGFRQMREREPGLRLWLLGVGPEEERIRALTKEQGLEESVRFLGFRSDLEQVLSLADIMVHPSHMEGVPLAILSGLAAGLPVVATAVGGLPEVVRNGESGILIPPGRPDELASAVLGLAGDEGRCRELGAAAKRFIEEEYSLDAAARRVTSLYKEMLA